MPILRTARRAAEWRDLVALVSIDVKHAYPSMPCERVWVALRHKLGARSALPVFRTLLGAEEFLSWQG